MGSAIMKERKSCMKDYTLDFLLQDLIDSG